MSKKTVALLTVILMLSLIVTAGCGSKQQQAAAPAYPTKPVTIIAPSGPGSGYDMTARAVAQSVTDNQFTSVALPVENRAGGGGAVALNHIIANKKGDPYTLQVWSPPLILINLNGQTQQSYKDLTPIAGLFSDYELFSVKKDSKYQNITEVMDALKKDPKSVKIGGASAPGSMDHLAFMMAAGKLGISVKDVPYISFQSGGELFAALLGGSVDVISTSVGDALGQLESGQIRGLATTAPAKLTDKRVASIPTLKDAGIDATFEVWRGIFGPPAMPDDAKKYWVDTIAKMTQTDSWKAILAKYNWQPNYRNPEEFTKFLDGQNQIMSDLLGSMGLLKK